MKYFGLVGNPNSGKTTLFNNLTGSTAHVGNWPGVTVDKREGVYKKLDEPISIVDLPGIYSLSPYTSEEVISRNYILDEKPDCIINIVDATNLERNLYLTTQLLEIDVPLVIALNMMDFVTKNGEELNTKIIEEKLGVPVVGISALKGLNIDELMKKGLEASKKRRTPKTILEGSDLNHLIQDIQIAFKGIKVENPLFHAIKLAELDELEVENHPNLVGIVQDFKNTFKDDLFGTDFEAIVADSRYKYITKHFSGAKYRKDGLEKKDEITQSDKIDKVLTNKWLGLPIFLLIMFFIFHVTFSENFLFLGFLFKDAAPSFAGTAFEGLIWTDSGINSPGIILFNLMDFTTGYIGGLVEGALEGSKSWVQGLICNGILGGVFGVLSFIPQILVLFLCFSILEDSGYMARVVFILDRILRKFGLSGRAFIPMIMGFGCSVPAMINTRTLSDEKEKIATIRVIPFFSCGAKLPILTAIAGGILEVFEVGSVDLITYGMYVLGMATAIVAVIIMRSTTIRGAVPPFIMELPLYHLPQFKSLMLHLWDKCKHFIHKAFTIILASTIVVWVLSHISWSWEYLEDIDMDKSILGSLGMILQPIFTPLGFGSQLTSYGWVFGVAAVTGLIAKEDVIGTFGTLAACIAGVVIDMEADGADVTAAVSMITATGITYGGLLAFIAFNMTTIPCFAAVATARAELPVKKFAPTILFWVVTSYIVSSVIYLSFEFTWTLFIIIPLFILVGLGIYFFNKYRDNKLVEVK